MIAYCGIKCSDRKVLGHCTWHTDTNFHLLADSGKVTRSVAGEPVAHGAGDFGQENELWEVYEQYYEKVRKCIYEYGGYRSCTIIIIEII